MFLDELPSYLEYTVAVPVGNANLGTVTTAALANLFVAVADMENVCLVLSDLAGSNCSVGQASIEAAFNRAVGGITAEAKHIAVPIPDKPNSRLQKYRIPENGKRMKSSSHAPGSSLHPS